ncbi:MAG: 50S ribosomal protein L24 [Candidatus Gracilibacteria bacterium]
MKLTLNDTVKIMRGKDRGKIAVIIAADHDTNKVKVEGVNVVTKHVKKNMGNPGELKKMENWIDVSNVMYYDSKEKKASRIKIDRDEKKKTVRIAKKTGAKIEAPKKK